MKKSIIIILCIVTIALGFYVGTKMDNPSENIELPDNNTIAENEQPFDDTIVEIPISNVEAVAEKEGGITHQEAEKLCRNVLGDKAEENGFPISYRCISAVSTNGKMYYVMNITWLVNDHHWSYIGNCFVSLDGQEIYDGVVSSEKYEITELRWKQ